jgi:phosphopantothenate synthetase
VPKTTKPKPKTPRKPDPPALPVGTAELLTRDQVAASLKVTTRTLSALIAQGAYPPPDASLGERLARWHRDTHNAALAKLAKKGGGGGV